MQQEHIERFIMLASLEMPNLIVSTLFQGAELSDESTLLTFSLPQKYLLEELIDELEDQMELILLYHHIPSEDTIFGHHCCAYSNPHFGHMYKINATTNGKGMISTIHVTIYDSSEFMYGDLCNDIKLNSTTGYFKFRREKAEILANFF